MCLYNIYIYINMNGYYLYKPIPMYKQMDQIASKDQRGQRDERDSARLEKLERLDRLERKEWNGIEQNWNQNRIRI